jgi:hypothetical protein
VGGRHHYLHLDPDRPEDTLLLHEQVGLSYDSTLGNERHLGWRNGLSLPFFPFHQGLRREIGTLQLPFAWMDAHLFHYRAENPGEPGALLEDLVARTAAQHGLLVVNVHDYVFDDALFPGWSSTYAGLVQHLSERGDFWIDTPRAIAQHWRSRAEAIAAASKGLDRGAATRPGSSRSPARPPTPAHRPDTHPPENTQSAPREY